MYRMAEQVEVELWLPAVNDFARRPGIVVQEAEGSGDKAKLHVCPIGEEVARQVEWRSSVKISRCGPCRIASVADERTLCC